MKNYLQECADLYTLYFIYSQRDLWDRAYKCQQEHLKEKYSEMTKKLEERVIKICGKPVTNFTEILYKVFQNNRGSWESESRAVYSELNYWFKEKEN